MQLYSNPPYEEMDASPRYREQVCVSSETFQIEMRILNDHRTSRRIRSYALPSRVFIAAKQNIEPIR